MRIIASGEFTHSDLYTACVGLGRTRILIAIAGFGMLMFALGLLGLWFGPRSDNSMVAIFPLLLGGAWAGLPWLLPHLSAKRMWDGPSFRGPAEYEFKDSGIRSNLPNAITEWQWSSFLRWKKTPTTLLLHTASNCALIIPIRFIHSESELAQVESLLCQNIGEPVR